jgi:hypothetical protein
MKRSKGPAWRRCNVDLETTRIISGRRASLPLTFNPESSHYHYVVVIYRCLAVISRLGGFASVVLIAAYLNLTLRSRSGSNQQPPDNDGKAIPTSGRYQQSGRTCR